MDKAQDRYCWIVSRLLKNHAVNGEIGRLTGDYRTQAEKLRDLPFTDRQAFFETKILPDDSLERDRMIRLVLAADPWKDPDQPTTFADLSGKIAATEWEWQDWLPRGFLTLLVAEQSIGKSYFALTAIGRAILCGGIWPDRTPAQHDPKSRILWCESEGMLAAHLERASKAGLPLSRILIWNDDPFSIPNLRDPRDADKLRDVVAIHKPRLLVLDSFSGAHNGKENSSDETLPVTRLLAEIAARNQIAVLVIHHLRKQTKGDDELTLSRIRGSSGITQFCRVVWSLHKADKRKAEIELAQLKNNLAVPPEPVGVRMDQGQFAYCDLPQVAPTAGASATDWLRDYLSNGGRRRQDAVDAGKAAGHSQRNIDRAKTALDLVATQDGKETIWTLPEF
ncbi:MAG: AAA family ATPase [Pirellulales bacterium]|nr:AAA family ATPase [Pirellulales bacterium]